MAKAKAQGGFITAEDALLAKIGKGILQSKLTNAELMMTRRLCAYPNNPRNKPKLATMYTAGGVAIAPYVSTKAR